MFNKSVLIRLMTHKFFISALNCIALKSEIFHFSKIKMVLDELVVIKSKLF